MIHTVSRALSLIVVVAALWVAWTMPTGAWYVTLGVVPSLLFIWFPEDVDNCTFGMWRKGYRIDAHTPHAMIAIAGWVLLLLAGSAVLAPEFLARLFGML